MNYQNYKNYVPFEKMTVKDNFPEFLVVHCSDSDYDNFESIQRYHITDPSRLYENYAYHFGIDKYGKRYKGRPVHYHGAHVGQVDTDGVKINNKSIGICLFGKFENKMPTLAATNELQKLLLELANEFNIKPAKVKPHRYWTGNTKTCYGSAIPNSWASDLLAFALKEVPSPGNLTPPKDCTAEVEVAVKKERQTLIQSFQAFLNSLIR